MIVIVLALLGVFLGLRAAGKRGGNRWDKAQYATSFAIAFALVGLLATVLLERYVF